MKSRIVYKTKGAIQSKDISIEDSGMARIHEGELVDEGDSDGCIFVRLQSWDDNKEHPIMSELVGNKIRITVEIVED